MAPSATRTLVNRPLMTFSSAIPCVSCPASLQEWRFKTLHVFLHISVCLYMLASHPHPCFFYGFFYGCLSEGFSPECLTQSRPWKVEESWWMIPGPFGSLGWMTPKHLYSFLEVGLELLTATRYWLAYLELPALLVLNHFLTYRPSPLAMSVLVQQISNASYLWSKEGLFSSEILRFRSRVERPDCSWASTEVCSCQYQESLTA